MRTPVLQGGQVPLQVEALYRRYGPMVLRRCRHLLRSDAEALDAMQDVFVQLLRHQDRLTGDAPSSLLYRMATNVCLNRLRGTQRHPETRDEELLQRIADASDPAEQSQARSVLERLFGLVPPSSRTIAVLHLLDGMTLEEVAAEVGLSVSGVRKRLRQLRGQLHELEALP